MDTPQWLRKTGYTLNNNSTTILSGAAVAGVVATAILAVKATPQARHNLVEKRAGRADIASRTDDTPGKRLELWNENFSEGLSLLEKFQAVWRPYLPAAVTGVATIACIIGSNHIGLRRNAALAGAYAIADTAFREYRDEVVKQLGKKTDGRVDDEVAKKQIDEHPMSSSQVYITGGGDVLCYDRFTGRYFQSNLETLGQKQNEFNADMLNSSMFASLNDWYLVIGLDAVDMGHELGFSVENLVKLVYTGHIADDGNPCIAVGFESAPRPDYGKL
jgi:Family of unknown function (DUF6353)